MQPRSTSCGGTETSFRFFTSDQQRAYVTSASTEANKIWRRENKATYFICLGERSKGGLVERKKIINSLSDDACLERKTFPLFVYRLLCERSVMSGSAASVIQSNPNFYSRPASGGQSRARLSSARLGSAETMLFPDSDTPPTSGRQITQRSGAARQHLRTSGCAAPSWHLRQLFLSQTTIHLPAL